jgi:hypothetical protein
MIHQVRPVYPKEATKAHIEGTVRFDVISKTSELSEIHLVSGNPTLVADALDAVKQWRYAGNRLNGEPVEVKTLSTSISRWVSSAAIERKHSDSYNADLDFLNGRMPRSRPWPSTTK